MQLQALKDLKNKAKTYTECLIKGHQIEEECRARLEKMPNGKTSSTCTNCDTPLRLEKSKDGKIRMYERYYTDE